MNLELTASIEAVPKARSALDEFRASMTARSLEDARLMLSELVGNSVRHGSRSDRDPIRVIAAIAGGVLRVEVRDRGPGFTPRPRTSSSAKDRQWGLFLVAKLADRWGVVEGPPTMAWFEVRVDRHDD